MSIKQIDRWNHLGQHSSYAQRCIILLLFFSPVSLWKYCKGKYKSLKKSLDGSFRATLTLWRVNHCNVNGWEESPQDLSFWRQKVTEGFGVAEERWRWCEEVRCIRHWKLHTPWPVMLDITAVVVTGWKLIYLHI